MVFFAAGAKTKNRKLGPDYTLMLKSFPFGNVLTSSVESS